MCFTSASHRSATTRRTLRRSWSIFCATSTPSTGSTCAASARKSWIFSWGTPGRGTSAKGPSDLSTIKFPVGTTVDAMERELILQTLGATGNNKTRAAELLGISLKTLHNKLKEYGGDRAETE